MFWLQGYVAPEDWVVSLVGAAVLFGPVYLPACVWGVLSKRDRKGLRKVLFRWWTGDPFTLEDLARSVLIFGSIGSGKTSGSGAFFCDQILRAGCGVLFITSKPEERGELYARIRKAGRMRDVTLFAVDSPHRLSFMESLPGDSRSLTHYLVTVNAMLNQDGNRKGGDAFWERENEKLFFNAIELLRQAYGRADAASIQRLVNTAAYSPDQLTNAKWREGFCWQTITLAKAKKGKTRVEENDFQGCWDYWVSQFPSTESKVRSSVLSGVTGLLHTMTTGLVREYTSTKSTFKISDLRRGRIVICDWSSGRYDETGRFIGSSLKYICQKDLLARHYRAGEPVVVIWSDEAQEIINPYDPKALNMIRSHGGCMILLTQSVSNIRICMSNDHAADALVGQFGLKVIHACDHVTAELGSKLVGSAMQTTTGGSVPTKPEDASFTFSSSVRPLVEPREFTTGLRTSGGVVDAWVVKNGKPFSGGFGNSILVPFRQG